MLLSWMNSRNGRRLGVHRRGHRAKRSSLSYQPRLDVLEDRLAPATLTVLNTADGGPGSLRQAILDANTVPGDDTITFASGLAGTIDLVSALPGLSSNIDLEGPGADKLTVQRSQAEGTPGFGIFHVTPGATVTLAGLTIANGAGRGGWHFPSGMAGGIFNEGTLTVHGCVISGSSGGSSDSASDMSSFESYFDSFTTPSRIDPTICACISYEDAVTFAGGINNRGTLTVSDSTFSGNNATNGGAILNDGTVSVSNSTFSGNSARSGGGIYNSGTLTIDHSTLRRNVSRNGGGIYNSGLLTISNSSFFGNTARTSENSARGGGISSSGTLFVSNSTFSRNTAGGDLYDISSQGGAIFLGGSSTGGTATIINSTLSANRVRGSGGALAIDSGYEATVQNSTITDNSATGYSFPSSAGGISVDGTLRISNSIVALNPAATVPDIAANPVVSEGHNLIGNGDGVSGWVASDLVGTAANPIDPKLGALQDRGGYTLIQPLLAGSPALDAGDNTDAPATDQQGQPRIQDGTIDIGAVEGAAQEFFQFHEATTSVGEDGGTVTLTVQRSGLLTGTATVAFSTSPSSAFADQDYTATEGMLTFLDGETSKTLSIPIRDDDRIEGSESFRIVLSNPTGGAILGPQATINISIIDDDGGGIIEIEPARVLKREGSSVVFTVTRRNGYAPLSVHVATDGTAAAGSDYTATVGDLTFAASETSKTITVALVSDAVLHEDPETFTVTLSNPTGGATLGTSQANVTIIDDHVLVANRNDSGPGSLRQAILDANSLVGDDTITFSPGVQGTIDLVTALPDLSSNIVLQGPGADMLTVERSPADGVPNFRIFRVTEGVTVTIADLTIANGKTEGAGGGINNSGTLMVSNAIFSGNSADSPWRGLVGDHTKGGGIYNSAVLTVRNSIFRGNMAGASGAGIYNSGTLTISDSTLTGNFAGSFGAYGSGAGGAIYSSGLLTVANSTLSGNQAVQGGGIFLGGTAAEAVTITNSTLSGNRAQDSGAGLFIQSEYPVTIRNSTITGNTVKGYDDSSNLGGGIGGSGDLLLGNSIVALNSASDLDTRPGRVRLTSDGQNLIGNGTAVYGLAPADLAGTAANPLDPMLGPLQDNGGPTFTHALLPGSAAIDAGDSNQAPTTDQRGLSRIMDGSIDIGAFEVQRITTPSQRFVARAYLELLRRPAEDAGLAFWSSLLDQGHSRDEVTQGIIRSVEYLTLQVRDLYRRHLDRDADEFGLGTFVTFLSTGGTVEGVAAHLVASPEYRQTRTDGSAAGFLQALYRDTFHRDADPTGLAAWGSMLASGANGKDVAEAIFASDEYHQGLVQGYYQRFLGRPGEGDGVAFWRSALGRGTRAEDVIALFVASEEYRDRLA